MQLQYDNLSLLCSSTSAVLVYDTSIIRYAVKMNVALYVGQPNKASKIETEFEYIGVIVNEKILWNVAP